MDRAAFLFTLWKKGLKPILLVLGIYFCITFIYQVFAEEGGARALTLLMLSLTIFILFIELMRSFFIKKISVLSARIPEKLKNGLHLILKYVSPIIFATVIYQAWQKDWIGTAIIISILLIYKLIEIIENRKKLEEA
jgi:hypothetical protein